MLDRTSDECTAIRILHSISQRVGDRFYIIQAVIGQAGGIAQRIRHRFQVRAIRAPGHLLLVPGWVGDAQRAEIGVQGLACRPPERIGFAGKGALVGIIIMNSLAAVRIHDDRLSGEFIIENFRCYRSFIISLKTL